MAEQDRKATTRPTLKDDAEVTANPRVAEKGETLKKTMDEIRDEIDAVLEKNAEEFVKADVQRGGE